jgi:hypothetical protein
MDGGRRQGGDGKRIHTGWTENAPANNPRRWPWQSQCRYQQADSAGA